MQSTDPIAGTREDVRSLPLATLCVVVALTAFAINFIAATGGDCGEFGCNGFPEWLYVGSGWLVMACLLALVIVLGMAAVRHVAGRRR
jgi:hypothetical protein